MLLTNPFTSIPVHWFLQNFNIINKRKGFQTNGNGFSGFTGSHMYLIAA